MQKPACSCSVQSGQKEETLIVDSQMDCDTESFKLHQSVAWSSVMNFHWEHIRIGHQDYEEGGGKLLTLRELAGQIARRGENRGSRHRFL